MGAQPTHLSVRVVKGLARALHVDEQLLPLQPNREQNENEKQTDSQKRTSSGKGVSKQFYNRRQRTVSFGTSYCLWIIILRSARQGRE
jgi:hypothetical protein